MAIGATALRGAISGLDIEVPAAEADQTVVAVPRAWRTMRKPREAPAPRGEHLRPQTADDINPPLNADG